MTLERECILLVDDDPHIMEALSLTLERAGRTLVLCSDVDSAEIALTRFPVTHLVTDVQFSGRFRFEGLHFMERVHAHAPNCRVILITGFATDDLRAEALRQGASAVLAKPFDTEDLEAALGTRELSDADYEVIRIPSIEEVLAGASLAAAFQPIVRVTPSGVVPFAYEALTRVRGNWLAGGPVMLFDYASRRSKLAELNVVTLKNAIAEAARLPEDATLFFNIDPLTFSGHALVPALIDSCERAHIDLHRVVLEVTERSGFDDDVLALRVFDELRGHGVRFALDDHGSAYSHLSLIDRIRPSFVKISNAFGTGFELDPTKERIVRHTVSLARDFGCDTILEGIETPATAQAAIDAGVAYAQGFHYGRPRPALHWTSGKAALCAA
jgi:EAL domain-containing protein (putative c-di-GMP-specific phosphodiesterase class I)